MLEPDLIADSKSEVVPMDRVLAPGYDDLRFA
jgi:hypothetical protein